MNNGKLVVIVFILASSLCVETFYLVFFTQPIWHGSIGEIIDADLIGFTSNNSAKFQIANIGYQPVTLMGFVMVNGMNSTLTPLEYENASIPIDGRVNFMVTLNGENQFIEDVDYTFVIETVHGTYFYETREFNTEFIIE